MRAIISRASAACIGAGIMCLRASPALAFSFTQPGGTMGVSLGASASAGLYFSNLANWGLANNIAANRTQMLAYESPSVLWSSGYTFFGASYSAAVAATFEETGVTGVSYERGVFNPAVTPVALSWKLGDFYVSFQENIYLPLNTAVAQPGAGFEQAVSFSYTGNDWVISANTIVGVTTADSGGLREPDYYNIDATIAHNFGPWEFGAIGYGSFDLETTSVNAAAGGPGRAVGVGGLAGYTFSGNIALLVMADHQVLTRGATEYAKDDTRIWTSLSIPIWTPAAASAPKPLAGKY